MVSTALVMPSDEEDLALTLNAKKKKIRRKDFDAAFKTIKIEEKQGINIYNKVSRFIPKAFDFIDQSFLTETDKEEYKRIIRERANRLELQF
ncbi:HipA domain-containing protein [Chitinophaga silvatica]|uniref:HipA domain-containing protein n=1 Tax=Chitinophaga silvatica TaxID=2282649 RepID=A0A3E1Y778_9BACT|nr:HipA domain-containing protein [Chitinophaga silvatica]RFS20951.1 HipA domain-containing protein [Chitinophaga silvatica]